MTNKRINKIVLAYSGGLDTSVMLRWLREKYRCEIVCYCADVGQGAEMDGLDLTKPLSPDEVAAVHAGMDKYAVLVFHDQPLTDDQQLAFTHGLGNLEQTANSSLRAANEYRLPPTFADAK